MLSIRKIGVVGRTYRHLSRYREILGVLFKYGFDDLIDGMNIERYLEVGLKMISRKRHARIERLTTPKRVRLALEELGPTFVKLGQILSTRPDLIPMPYIEELAKLQDAVPHFPYEEVRKIVKEDTGEFPETFFLRFEETPLAAASIGQVHRARLRNGEDVVVKVQRPGIREVIEIDLEILLHLAFLMERHLEELELHRPTRIVEEFARMLEKEIDYRVEASSLERFARQFIDDRTIYVPKVYRDLTTARILIIEFVDGIKVSEVERLRAAGYDLKTLVERGTESILRQIFLYGFFHGDPHPGNVFVLPNHVICYLDFGVMGRVSRQERELFVDLIIHVAGGEERKAVAALLQLTSYEERPDVDELEKDVSALIDQYLYRSLKELDIGALLHRLMEMLTRHNLSLKPNLFLMLRAISTSEGVARALVADFEIARYLEPFIRRVQYQRLNPKRLAGDMFDMGSSLLRLLREFPTELSGVLRQMSDGKVRIQFEHKGLDPMLSSHDRISNRIAFAIVLAALIIGSSLMVLAGIPPKWNEIPVIGLAGFVVAGIMGFWLLVSILRRGRM